QLGCPRRWGRLKDVRVGTGILEETARTVARRPEAHRALEDVAKPAAQRGASQGAQPQRRGRFEHEAVTGQGEAAEHGRAWAGVPDHPDGNTLREPARTTASDPRPRPFSPRLLRTSDTYCNHGQANVKRPVP